MSNDRHATMTTAAEYRQYAEECLAAMRAAVIPEVRAALCVAAQRWTALADRLEEEELPVSPSVHAGRHGRFGAPVRN
jgi:hypothetical protein